MSDEHDYEFEIRNRYSATKPELVLHDKQKPNFKARLATVLMERWGNFPSIADGEASNGHPKARMETPEELVNRACATASLAVERFRELGWMQPVPSLEEIRKQTERDQLKQN